MNHYFELSEPCVIRDIETLFSLNLERTYYRPGNPDSETEPRAPSPNAVFLRAHPFSTTGLFRGQMDDWPLIPGAFRGVELSAERPSDVVLQFSYARAMRPFREFCERAERHNSGFPENLVARMSIAQHFGIPTPLLDWSQNIFAAIFFAIRDIFEKEEDEPRVFVYHVADERLLQGGIPEEEGQLPLYLRSGFVRPFPIDRRIERQRGMFTYHPHPELRPVRIPAARYVLEADIILRLLDLMKGFGFTEDYFFPDYAGIAAAVMAKRYL
jgi:hypothetical protein